MKNRPGDIDLICECDCWCMAVVYRGPVEGRPDPVPSCLNCQDGEHIDEDDR